MLILPTPTEVLDALGDKVTAGLTAAVTGARADLQRMRQTIPDIVADFD